LDPLDLLEVFDHPLEVAKIPDFNLERSNRLLLLRCVDPGIGDVRLVEEIELLISASIPFLSSE